ncbi:MAG: Ig-like domain-containing protein, partial [Chloroflexi bacterium]|nr:Ig-like domain-containing protein [Chloroflexota bacterium]
MIEPSPSHRLFQLERFDLLVAAAILVLLAAIGGVVFAGDHVGIYIVEDGFAPVGRAGGADPIRVRFSDAMSQSSVAEHFRIEPAVEGDLNWISQDILIFTPHRPLSAEQIYTVTITRGARSAKRGVTLHDDFSWSFTVRTPRAVYLAPSDEYDRNLFMTDLEDGSVYQLTASENGVEDFAVSPQGNEIAYAQYNADGSSDLWILHLINQTNRQITNCVDARCFGPAWNADGTQVAYNREDYNSGLGLGPSSSRVWVVDVKSLRTQLLFEDS